VQISATAVVPVPVWGEGIVGADNVAGAVVSPFVAIGGTSS
jgi:hypothetical protein